MNPIQLIKKLTNLYQNFKPVHRVENDILIFEIEKPEFDTQDYLNFQLTASNFHYAFRSVSFKENRLVIKIKSSL